MRKILLAMMLVLGFALLAPVGASAAPANGASIGATLDKASPAVEAAYVCRRVCGPYGCRRNCFYTGGPAYVAPFVAGPVCRSVRVCDWRGCFWRRRCW